MSCNATGRIFGGGPLAFVEQTQWRQWSLRKKQKQIPRARFAVAAPFS